MSREDHNWQLGCSKVVEDYSWRLFIKEYQSSPTELIVSAINERSRKVEEDYERNVDLLGPLGEVVARKLLYFSNFEDIIL